MWRLALLCALIGIFFVQIDANLPYYPQKPYVTPAPKPWNPSPPTARWMELMDTVLAPMTIPDMVLPGTHDTGTYLLMDSLERDPDSMPEFVRHLIDVLQKDFGIIEPYKIIREWARTQSYRVYDQLVKGIRFLDIRVCWSNSTFRTEHTVLGDYTETLLADIALFMQEYPKEVIVLEFGSFNAMGDAQHRYLLQKIEQYLGEWLWPRTWGWQTYSDMIAQNKRIIALYDNEVYVDMFPEYWSSSHLLTSDWANKDEYSAMEAIEYESLALLTGDPNRVYKLQWILTASARRVIDSISQLFPPYHNLHDLTKDANRRFDYFISNNSNYRINLLMVDWFEETDNVEQARLANLQSCNDSPLYRKPTPTNPLAQNCPNWARMGLCASNRTVATLCPLSCRLCKPIPGAPGDRCKSDSECLYGTCHQDERICLTDWPLPNGQSCGASGQCASGKCQQFRCIGRTIYAPCSNNATCGSGHCATNGRCAGTPEIIVVGSAPFCDSTPMDCDFDPRGLVFLAPISCDAHTACLDGRRAAVCSNALLPFSSYYWVGEAPICTIASCGPKNSNATVVFKSKCGAGNLCLEGTKLLCGKI